MIANRGGEVIIIKDGNEAESLSIISLIIKIGNLLLEK